MPVTQPADGRADPWAILGFSATVVAFFAAHQVASPHGLSPEATCEQCMYAKVWFLVGAALLDAALAVLPPRRTARALKGKSAYLSLAVAAACAAALGSLTGRRPRPSCSQRPGPAWRSPRCGGSPRSPGWTRAPCGPP